MHGTVGGLVDTNSFIAVGDGGAGIWSDYYEKKEKV
jgi:hypothetical protein